MYGSDEDAMEEIGNRALKIDSATIDLLGGSRKR